MIWSVMGCVCDGGPISDVAATLICVCMLCTIHTMMKSPNETFLKCIPVWRNA